MGVNPLFRPVFLASLRRKARDLQRDKVIEYLQMPERARKLEWQLEDVNRDLDKINGNIERVSVILEKLVNMEDRRHSLVSIVETDISS
jgi:hypothetical protein